MNYISLEFWVTLVALLLPYLLLRAVLPPGAGRFDRFFLLGLSFALFAIESPQSFAIFLGVGLLVFVAVRALPRSGRARWATVGLVAFLALLPLGYYKYRGFLTGNPAAVEPGSVLIPIGISFYTFQLIGLLVDHAKSPDERIGAVEFFNFASFFPQIVAGPIERKDSLLPQIERFRFAPGAGDLAAGLRYVVLGLFYKLVVADNLAAASGWVLAPVVNPWLVHLGNVTFGLRIYFDFCGYSLIALGLGRMLGITLTVNFLSPYSQTNIQMFWRTWHRSLSNWFRDYVYIPMGGNRSKLALVVVFLVSGVWHGAGWNFVLWGLSHGLMVLVFAVWGSRMRMPRLVAWAVTMFFVAGSWLFFYEVDSGQLADKALALVSPLGYAGNPVPELLALAGSYGDIIYLAAGIALGVAVVGLEAVARLRSDGPYGWAMPLWVQAAMVLLLVWASPLQNNGFVYFNF